MIKTWEEYNEGELNYEETHEGITEGIKEKSGSYMAIANLRKIKDMVDEILKKIPERYVMDRWAEDHLASSADDIDEVYSYLMYGEGLLKGEAPAAAIPTTVEDTIITPPASVEPIEMKMDQPMEDESELKLEVPSEEETEEETEEEIEDEIKTDEE